jgi:hypothetical protein
MSLTSNKLRQLLLQSTSGSPALDLLGNANIKVMLVGTGYTPDKDHDFVDSITGGSSKELSGTGYVAGFGGSGRKTLASKTVTKDNTNDVAFFDAADVTWTAINAGTVAYAVVIKEVTNDADSPILATLTISPNIVTNGSDYTEQWAADGLFKIA